MPVKIIVDAGHGGYDNGAIYKDRREKDDNLALALLLRDELEARGADVYLTRDTDVYDSPAKKAALANESAGDLFISLHRNAAYAPNTYQGVQTLVYDKSGSKLRIAKNINEKLEELGFNNISVDARPDLAVLRRTKMPAILVESGFIDNDYDNMLFENNIKDIATSIADAIMEVMSPKAVVSYNLSMEKLKKPDMFYIGETLSEGDNQEEHTGEEAWENSADNNDNKPDKAYKIQVGYFTVFKYAKDLERELCMNGYDTLLEKEGEAYVLYVGTFDDISDAKACLEKLKMQGYDAFIV